MHNHIKIGIESNSVLERSYFMSDFFFFLPQNIFPRRLISSWSAFQFTGFLNRFSIITCKLTDPPRRPSTFVADFFLWFFLFLIFYILLCLHWNFALLTLCNTAVNKSFFFHLSRNAWLVSNLKKHTHAHIFSVRSLDTLIMAMNFMNGRIIIQRTYLIENLVHKFLIKSMIINSVVVKMNKCLIVYQALNLC